MATSQRLNRGFHRLAIFLAARKREAAKWRGLSSERLLLGISLIGIKPGPPPIVLPPKPVPPPRPRPSRRRADQPRWAGRSQLTMQRVLHHQASNALPLAGDEVM